MSIPIPVEIALDYRVLGFTAIRATAADPVAGPEPGAVGRCRRSRIILSEAAARLRFHNEDPIGKLLDSGGAQVIGVARDTRRESLRPRVEPWSFVPFAQSPQPWMSILIRTTGNPQALVDEVRRAALEIDPSIPASSVRLMTDQLKALLWQPRMAALLVGAFALLAALLAVIGVYGAVSFEVARRTHEIGIRMALGADRPAVLRMVLIRSVRVAFLGAAVGLCAAAGLTRLLAAMLYTVTPTDPGILVSASVLLIVVVALASSIPAHRASSVDPIAVLRYR